MSTAVFGTRVWLIALVSINVAQVAGAVAQGSGVVWARVSDGAIRAENKTIQAFMGVLSVMPNTCEPNRLRRYDEPNAV
jgi:hypothetical protein